MTTETATRIDAYVALKQTRIDAYVARKQPRIDAHLARTGACIDAWRANRDRRLPDHGEDAILDLDEAPGALARP